MTSRISCCTWIAMAAAACSAGAETGARSGCTEAATLSARLTFAEQARAKRILSHRDAWVKQLSKFDLGARMRTTEPVGIQDFLAFAGEQGLGWSAEEEAGWKPVVEKLSGALKGLRLHIPAVELVKSTGMDEFNAPYTRARAVILPASRASLPAANSRAAFFLLAHELFPVLSREDSTLQDQLYALLGFKVVSGFEYPAELEATRGSNPDAFEYLHVLAVQTASGRADVMPLVQTSRTVSEVLRLSSFFEALDVVLLAVDTNTGKAVRNENGQLVKFSFANTDWVPQMQRNSSYIIHPEELLADNFATLMEWRAEGNVPARNPAGDAVDDMRLLTAIRDALLADCGQ
ncbi:MAG: hypothetical protein JNL62_05905 [Bryobacterales bacterium]|nr:hypothetical protein [Bryobacterales bacterium]